MVDIIQEISRTLYFYTLELSPYPIYDDSITKLNLNKYILEKVFEQDKTYPINNNKVVEIIEFTDTYIFGSIGKNEDITTNALKRQRKSSTLELIEDNSYLNSILFEDFTYFLIGNKFNDIVVLQNSDAPSIKSTLIGLIKQISMEVKTAWIHNKVVKDLPNALGKFQEILKVELVAASDIANLIKPSIKELHSISNDSIEKLCLSINLKREMSNKEFISALCENPLSDYTSFKVKGINSDTNIVETLDVISKLLTKKISLNISNDSLRNVNYIKQILYRELLANIEGHCNK